MRRVKIDKNLLNLELPESHSLVSAISTLSRNGYELFSDEVPESLSAVFKNEGINFSVNPLSERGDFEIKFLNDEKQKKVALNDHYTFKNLFDTVNYIVKTKRESETQRTTKETDIKIRINIDGSGESNINTGIGFFDHMLEQISRHGNIDLQIKVDGDLHVDEHHTVEDVGIALGEAILKALGEKKGIKRYGYFLPMDETIAKFAIDIGGRQYLNFKCKFEREFVGEFPTELTAEFFKGIAQGLRANIFVRAKGKNDHHKIEAIFKAFAKSLNEACRIDERAKGKLPTTKGLI
jgi:imidazoleglycerol-phosphate dehydratase/histidinol-phosphatase